MVVVVFLSEFAAQLAQCCAQLRFLSLQLLDFPTAAGPLARFKQLGVGGCQCFAFGTAGPQGLFQILTVQGR
jgi:hypothetical protein